MGRHGQRTLARDRVERTVVHDAQPADVTVRSLPVDRGRVVLARRVEATTARPADHQVGRQPPRGHQPEVGVDHLLDLSGLGEDAQHRRNVVGDARAECLDAGSQAEVVGMIERDIDLRERGDLPPEPFPDPEAEQRRVRRHVHAVGAGIRAAQVAETGVIPATDVAPQRGLDLLAPRPQPR